MSITTTSLLCSIKWEHNLFNSTCSGHTHPEPPVSTVPKVNSPTPLCILQYFSGISSTLGFNLNILLNVPSLVAVLSETNFFITEIGTIESYTSFGKPSAKAKFASGSASTATTL